MMDEQMLDTEILEDRQIPDEAAPECDADPVEEPEEIPSADYDGEIALLREQYPELLHESGTERYRELRTLGLTPGEAYLATSEPYDKAGAYAIQGFASLWISGIRGCYFNVVGLPVHRLNRLHFEVFGKKLI